MHVMVLYKKTASREREIQLKQGIAPRDRLLEGGQSFKRGKSGSKKEHGN